MTNNQLELKTRVITQTGPGTVITLPPNRSGSQIYVVLLDNGRAILCDVKNMQPA